MLLKSYSSRVDISALHASFLNSKSRRSSKASVKSLIGSRPVLSDELESKAKSDELLKAFKVIFPDKRGVIEVKKRKTKPKK